jgi:beta-lactam-binding protein with PASTA domain
MFWRNIAYALAIMLFFLFFTMSCLKIYTHHGRSSAVPDFTDMSLEEATSLIEDRKFRHEIFDSHFVADKNPGVILDQHPLPGELVKKNRKIFFTINASSPGTIEMPSLVGITLREARIRLEAYGMKLGRLYYRYDISENVVLEQQFEGNKIEPNDSIVLGSSIDLVLGKGLANARRMVPDLIGKSVKEAEYIVSDATFHIGAVIEDNSITEAADSLQPFIFKQKPESHPDIKRPLGSTISLYITVDSTKLPGYIEPEESEYIWNELNDENQTDTLHSTTHNL